MYETKNASDALLEGKKKKKQSSQRDQLQTKFGITEFGTGNVGFSPTKKKWYGWSHRAVAGFGVGDKIFEANFGDDNTPFNKHGSKDCKTLDDAKESARRFAEYVS